MEMDITSSWVFLFVLMDRNIRRQVLHDERIVINIRPPSVNVVGRISELSDEYSLRLLSRSWLIRREHTTRCLLYFEFRVCSVTILQPTRHTIFPYTDVVLVLVCLVDVHRSKSFRHTRKDFRFSYRTDSTTFDGYSVRIHQFSVSTFIIRRSERNTFISNFLEHCYLPSLRCTKY